MKTERAGKRVMVKPKQLLLRLLTTDEITYGAIDVGDGKKVMIAIKDEWAASIDAAFIRKYGGKHITIVEGLHDSMMEDSEGGLWHEILLVPHILREARKQDLRERREEEMQNKQDVNKLPRVVQLILKWFAKLSSITAIRGGKNGIDD